MTEEFPVAVRENVWLRMLLSGLTKSGKTDGALAVATSLSEALGGVPIVAVDTENGRMKLYADRYKFRHTEIVDDYSPDAWIAKMDAAERTFPGGILILDSVTHEWTGRMGILERVDNFGGWKVATPLHQTFTGRIASLQMHVIACVRSKVKHSADEGESESGRKKLVVRKLGVGPEQRENFVYEFDLVGEIDYETHLASFESRDDLLAAAPVDLRDPAVGETIAKWLSEGAPMEAPPAATDESVAELLASLKAEGFADELIEERFAVNRRQNRGKLHPDYVAEQLEKSAERRKKAEIAKKAEGNGAGEGEPAQETLEAAK